MWYKLHIIRVYKYNFKCKITEKTEQSNALQVSLKLSVSNQHKNVLPKLL